MHFSDGYMTTLFGLQRGGQHLDHGAQVEHGEPNAEHLDAG